MIRVGTDNMALATTDRKDAHDFIRELSGVIWVGDQKAKDAKDAHRLIEEQTRG